MIFGSLRYCGDDTRAERIKKGRREKNNSYLRDIKTRRRETVVPFL